MDIDKILQKFGVFSGLSGDALTACLPYCQDAMAELTAKTGRPALRRSRSAPLRRRWPTTGGVWPK